jgi:alkylhydroperoxidase family enzyme
MLDVNPDWVAAAEQNNIELIGDLKLRAMVAFAVKCARNPQSLAPSDFSQMRAFGLKESEIVEIIGMAAFAVYANIIADATAMQNDEMFGEL